MTSKNIYSRLFLETIGSMILGRHTDTKIVCSRDEMSTITEALMASTDLGKEINNPNATVSSIADKSEKKRIAAAKFQNLFGVEWPI